ncbi:nitrate reductase cytochrome c-type subunit [Shewanella insulae]|uniref:nitrate reductase cytochrome c-type subunit n=1 Tax=Shewanella insulae TaxID=2681496 RepID=UPI001EFE57A6|nr:nitrate reductase cytochrome c-type subunit [Shewanella insulae]MCG9738067.1 nitrate reductase cytochrome c-type subunit [Shewanella insulae]
MKKVLTLVALMALGACSGQQSKPAAEPVNVSSLGKGEITAVRAADEMPTYPKKGQSIERGFVHQPPLIPHKADYKISIKKNGCMTCHSPKKAKRMKATEIHSSHILADNKLNYEYFNCTQCHVPQAENKQKLVENNFSNQ